MIEGCLLCPRRCGAARTPDDPGRCGSGESLQSSLFRVASLMRHFWEEPCISGYGGSGTVFFSGCALSCCFCQNGAISHGHQGTIMTESALIEAILLLHAQGVHNLNLVTASHYADRLPQLISRLKSDLRWQMRPLPVIWNSSGYESVETVVALADHIDVWLPDFKFFGPQLAKGMADAPDYFTVASQAILAMHDLQPKLVCSEEGIIQRGLILRHLVLPGHWRDSCRLLDWLAEYKFQDVPLSLMCQYTPQPGIGQPSSYPELKRRLTTFEYRKVLDHALDLGFTRILGQDRGAADLAYTPDFSSVWLDTDGRGASER